MKLLTKVTAIFNRTVDLLAVLAAVTLIFMMLIVIAQVVLRPLGQPLMWVLEVAGYGVLYVTFLGTAWVLKKEGHVKMDIVLTRLSPRTQSLMTIITSIIAAIICFILAWYGVKVTWEYFKEGHYFESILFTPKWLILLIIPIGSFLLFIQFLRRAYGYLRIWKGAQKLETGDIDETVSL